MSSPGLSMYDHVNKPAFVAASCIFTGLAIICNAFMIITILFSSLRSSAKHLAILALCLVDLYQACAMMALSSEFFALETWNHDLNYFIYMDYAQPMLLSAFRSFLLITICLVTLMSMFTTNRSFLNLMSVSMVFASLFYSLVLILPHRVGHIDDLSVDCFVEKARMAGSVSFFPQATILLVLLIDICIVSCCCTRSFDDVTSGGQRRIPIEVILAVVVFLVFVIPYSVVGTYFSTCSGGYECRVMHIVRAVTLKWEDVRFFLQPLIWLLCADVRNAVGRVFCCRKNDQPTNQQPNQPYYQPPYQPYVQQPNQPYVQPPNQPYVLTPNQQYYQQPNQQFNMQPMVKM